MPRILISSAWVGVVMAVGTGTAFAQTFPARPLRIVTGGVGSGSDFVARLLAHGLIASLGQQVIVENRGSGAMPGQLVAKAQADGHTLLLYGNAMWLSPLMQERMPYDPIRDFAPISLTTRAPNVLVVATSVPVKSVKDLIALARLKPGELNYASGPAGSLTHLAAELFKVMSGVNIVRVNYKGTGPALNDLLSERVQVMFPTAATVTPHMAGGKLRALAVTSAQPSELLPGLPTVSASGVAGYESVAVQAVFAPAKTPPMIINRLHQDIVRFLDLPETRQRLVKAGVEIVGASPEQLLAAVKSEMAGLGKVIKEAGIRAE